MEKITLKSVFHHCNFRSTEFPLFPFKQRTVKDYYNIAEIAYENIQADRLYKTIECYCIAQTSNFLNGYFGAAFLDLRFPKDWIDNKNFKPQIIFTHRGTNTNKLEFVQDITTDFGIGLQLFGIVTIPSQYRTAFEFIDTTQTRLRISSSKISTMHTGHSLGAALAQMCAHEFFHKSIGFEAPGIAKILEKLNPNNPIIDENHIIFRMNGSYISGMLPQRGKVFSCLAKDPIILSPGSNIGELHLMKHMLPCLNSDGNFVLNPKIIK